MASFINEETDTKNEKTAFESTDSAISPTVDGKRERDLDEAFKYLNEHTNAELGEINLAALRRKIDWRIVPIMFTCYTLQFVDKVVINVGLHPIPRW